MWIHGVWLLVGTVLGILHTAGVCRTARNFSMANAIMSLVRLMFLSLALVTAAFLGGILAAAAGWAIGFIASCAVMMASGRCGTGQSAT